MSENYECPPQQWTTGHHLWSTAPSRLFLPEPCLGLASPPIFRRQTISGPFWHSKAHFICQLHCFWCLLRKSMPLYIFYILYSQCFYFILIFSLVWNLMIHSTTNFSFSSLRLISTTSRKITSFKNNFYLALHSSME